MATDILLKEVSSTSLLNGPRGILKFWQTLGKHPTSPFTLVEIQSRKWMKVRSLDGSIAKHLHNFLKKESDSSPKVGVSEHKENNLEQLSEELI